MNDAKVVYQVLTVKTFLLNQEYWQLVSISSEMEPVVVHSKCSQLIVQTKPNAFVLMARISLLRSTSLEVYSGI